MKNLRNWKTPITPTLQFIPILMIETFKGDIRIMQRWMKLVSIALLIALGVTALGSAYAHEGSVCQNFLASYVRDGRETWYQGGACQSGAGWQVREFKPLQRTAT